MPFGIEHSDVPRVKPSFPVNHFCRGFGAVVVTQHDIGAFGEYFPILSDLNLHSRYRFPHRSVLEIVEAIDGQHRRCLRQAIAFNDRYADSLKEFAELAGKRGPTGHEEADPSPRPFTDFAVYEV